jgi:Flp pilus assembly protein CpaB
MPLFATLKPEQMCQKTDYSLHSLLPDIRLLAAGQWVTQADSASMVPA